MTSQPISLPVHWQERGSKSESSRSGPAVIFPSGYACEDQRTNAAGHCGVRSMTDEPVGGQPCSQGEHGADEGRLGIHFPASLAGFAWTGRRQGSLICPCWRPLI